MQQGRLETVPAAMFVSCRGVEVDSAGFPGAARPCGVLRGVHLGALAVVDLVHLGNGKAQV